MKIPISTITPFIFLIIITFNSPSIYPYTRVKYINCAVTLAKSPTTQPIPCKIYKFDENYYCTSDKSIITLLNRGSKNVTNCRKPHIPYWTGTIRPAERHGDFYFTYCILHNTYVISDDYLLTCKFKTTPGRPL